MTSAGNVWDWCIAVDQVLWGLVLQTAMHCDSQFVVYRFLFSYSICFKPVPLRRGQKCSYPPWHQPVKSIWFQLPPISIIFASQSTLHNHRCGYQSYAFFNINPYIHLINTQFSSNFNFTRCSTFISHVSLTKWNCVSVACIARLHSGMVKIKTTSDDKITMGGWEGGE